MEKPAPTEHEVHPLVRQRWSPHTFSDKNIDDATLMSLLEAARWAPSSYNEQPWAFIIARRQEQEDFQRLFSCLVEGNQAWAKSAAALVITAYRPVFSRNDKPNRVAQFDVGGAMAWLTMQAESMGLRVHQMAGVELDRARSELKIPDGYEPLTAAAIGYPGSPDSLPEDLLKRETADRTRRPFAEFVFQGKWDTRPGTLG